MFAGIVLATLGADVLLTDLGPNLPLLQDNCTANGMPAHIPTGMIAFVHLCIRLAAILHHTLHHRAKVPAAGCFMVP